MTYFVPTSPEFIEDVAKTVTKAHFIEDVADGITDFMGTAYEPEIHKQFDRMWECHSFKDVACMEVLSLINLINFKMLTVASQEPPNFVQEND